MNHSFNIKQLAFTACCISILFIGCKSDDEIVVPRLFSPIISLSADGINVTNGTGIAYFKWDRLTGAKTYELALSTDTFKNVILQPCRTDSVHKIFYNLECSTTYQVRIRAIGSQIMESTKDTIRSNDYWISYTSDDFPTQLNVPSNITGTSAKISWTSYTWIYTRMDIISGTTVIQSINLTGADNTAGFKNISGLQKATTYIVKIYDANGYKGKTTFTTAAS